MSSRKQTLNQSISIQCPLCTVNNHLGNARCLVRSTCTVAYERWTTIRLHQAWVADAIGIRGSNNVDAASGFLHDDGKNKAMINERSFSDLLNRGQDVVSLIQRVAWSSRRVVFARLQYHWQGFIPQGIEWSPLTGWRKIAGFTKKAIATGYVSRFASLFEMSFLIKTH